MLYRNTLRDILGLKGGLIQALDQARDACAQCNTLADWERFEAYIYTCMYTDTQEEPENPDSIYIGIPNEFQATWPIRKLIELVEEIAPWPGVSRGSMQEELVKTSLLCAAQQTSDFG